MAASTEPRSGLFHTWDLGEDGWNTGMDANLLSIGRFAYHPSVKDRDLATPPGSPADGDSYIVGATATGAWASQENKIAVWDATGAAWVFGTPRLGWSVYVEDESVFLTYSGSAWAGTGTAITGGTIDNTVIGGTTPAPGTFTTVTANRLAASGDYLANGGDISLTNTNGGRGYRIGEGIGGITPDALIVWDSTASAIRLTLDSAGNITKHVAAAANGGMVVHDGTNDLFGFGTGGYASNGGSATDGGIRTRNNMLFSTGASSDLRMTLDSAGNLGLGVAPSAHSSSFRMIDIGNYASFGQQTAGTSGVNIGWNAQGSSTGNAWVYRRTGDVARLLEIDTLGFKFYTDQTAGTAGDPITSFTDAKMTLDGNGNLGLGVAPSAHNTRGFDIGAFAGIYQNSAGASVVGFNNYQNGAGNYVYKTANAAARYDCGVAGTGGHAWYTAASGSGGATVTDFSSAKMTLDANNQLLLGGTSTNPITGFSGGAVGLTIETDLPTLALADSSDSTNYRSWLANSGGALYLYNFHSTSPIIFGTNNVEKMRLDSSGNLTLNTGNVILASGAGIDFSATANGSGTTTSELLDDYEEGAVTLGTNFGTVASDVRYTKIGRMVTVHGYIATISDQSTASQFILTGLPFTSGSASNSTGACFYRHITVPSSGTNLTPYVSASTTTIQFYTSAAGDYAPLQHQDFNNAAAQIYFSITYEAT